MTTWKDSRADRALRSIRAMNSINFGLEGGGAYITADMSNLHQSAQTVDDVKASLDADLKSVGAVVSRNVLPLTVAACASLAISWILGNMTEIPSGYLVFPSLFAVALAVTALTGSIRAKHYEYAKSLREQMEPSGHPLAAYEVMLQQELNRVPADRLAAVVEQLSALTARGTPVVRIEDQTLRTMLRIRSLPQMPDWGIFN